MFRYNKPCHFKTIYGPKKPIKNQETNLNEIQEADALYIHKMLFLNEDKMIPKNLDINEVNTNVWYLDN